jgi:hypothetical protein
VAVSVRHLGKLQGQVRNILDKATVPGMPELLENKDISKRQFGI